MASRKVLIAVGIFVPWSTLVSGTLLSFAQGPDIELLLQHPLEYDRPADQCLSDSCISLVNLINEADSTIDFAVYGTRMQSEILNALLRAQDRGIALRGYMDKDRKNKNYYTSTEKWMQAIQNVRDDYPREVHCKDDFDGEPPCTPPPGFNGPLQCLAYDLGENRILLAGHAARKDFSYMSIMHNKFFVIDQARIWTGSANISNSGTGGYNANAVVVVRSRDVAEVFTEEFNQLWNREDHCEKTPNGIEEFHLPSGKLTTWFSPQDQSLRYGVRSLIAKAEKRIHVAIFFLTAKYLTADLINAHRRGVDVRVIIDATSAKNEYTKHSILRKAGIPVKIENWGGKMHMKAASIDNRYLVLGSMNWTSAGERSNDENSLLLDSPELARQFDTYYENIWQSIPQVWQRINARPDPESHDSGTSCNDGVDNDFDDLADAQDPGCRRLFPPPLPPLPPDRIISPADYDILKDDYPMIRPLECDPSYPDWYVCVSKDEWGGCSRLPYRKFTALPPDSRKLDKDGDGIAC